MITPNESTTFVPRHEASDDPVKIPLILIVGDNKGNVPRGRDRIATFTGSLVVGRREPTQGEPGQSSLVLPDRMVSSQHLAISPSSDNENYELTDLSSTNGTVVDGEPVETTVRLRDGAVVFVGSHVLVFRITSMAQKAAIEAELTRPFGPVATTNPAFAMVCKKLRALAIAGEEMLLTGETGVGKEVYATAIHRASERPGRFVAINCAAIPRELVETELFGYARGAHSQAAMAKPGIIEEAENGTLFLDEIGEMVPELQTKLLRFTQDRMLAPVGGLRARRLETRIVAATSRTAAPSQSGSLGLRVDLAARLGAEPIQIPPLRERIEDLGALASYLMADRNKPIDLPAFQALCLYQWPGNVRELGKVMTQAEALARDAERIGVEHLPAAILQAPKLKAAQGRRKSRPPPDAAELEALIRRFHGNMMRVARELDRKPALVYRWAKRFGLNADDFRTKKEA
ncbi:MAG TPA: sigma 54-interacting transcriptional regulator [Polyangia bacterium]|nr:sigma 54-interacting transcriptional regulator [Polyangia bacterium]